MMRYRSTSVKRELVAALPADGTNALFELWLVSRAVTELLDAALSPTGLTADEFAIYSVLTSAEAFTPSELARWMSAPPTTVSSHLKRFEQRGHVARERTPGDGRSYRIHLTAAGRDAHANAAREFAPVLAQIVDRLGTREPTLRRALASLGDAVDATAAAS